MCIFIFFLYESITVLSLNLYVVIHVSKLSLNTRVWRIFKIYINL